tara:strand:- start:238 stop:1218 length:981 start_codon:yes stop_codon:yes gene_type:complete
MNVDSQESNQNLSILDATNEVLKASQVEQQEETQEEPQETEQQITEEETETEQTEVTETSEVEEEAEADQDVAEEVAEETETEALYTVKVDGVEEEVDLNELKRGYIGGKTFHQRMNELHKEKQAFSKEADQYRANRDAYAQGLGELQKLFQRQEPNWAELKQTLTPEQYNSRVADYTLEQNNLRKLQEEQKAIAQEQQREATVKWQDVCVNEAKLLLDKVPDWNKEKQDATVKFAKEVLNFSDEEISQASDHRMILAIYGASQNAKNEALKPQAKKIVKNAPKATKSGQPKSKNEILNNNRNKLRQAYNKNPTKQGAVELLMKRG